MGYGYQDFHIEDFADSFRRTSPVKREMEGGGLRPLTDAQRNELLNLGALGLAGEGGEVIDLIKKHLFHAKPLDRDKLIEELGDQLWYFQCLLEAVDASFEDVVKANIAKLTKRYPDGFKPGGGVR